ncbi:hypothetical protein B0H12DRAFT_87941 [Mycena haematopus]|nr:hypothetical protein B0H12DRAFT_87941 [Mycena haematopus]
MLVEPPSAIVAPSASATGSPAQALSPLRELESLMLSITLSNPPPVPMVSPLLQSPTLPALVPIMSPTPYHGKDFGQAVRRIPVPQAHRGRTLTRNTPIIRTPIPPVYNAAVPLPCPASPIQSPTSTYVDDLLVWRPKSTGFPALRNASRGSYKRSKKPVPARRKPKFSKTKHCYFCAATSHLLATCPKRELD